ncbi:MAG: methyl-accepting chemotaxis protein [Betaproteobacteria bacterium]|nr:methyl-accepting chemotaxis protein [Betaproteobacteria bacterium]
MFTNLKIRTRFYILIGFSSLMLIWVGATGLSGIHTTSQAVSSIYNDRLVAIERLGEVRNEQMLIRITLGVARQETDAFEILAQTDKINGMIFRVGTILKEYEARKMPPEEKALFDAFSKARQDFGGNGVMPMISLLTTEKFAEADKLRAAVLDPGYAKASAAIDALLKYQVDAAMSEYQSATAYAAKVRIISIASIVAGLTLSILTGLFITRAIAQGVGELVRAASSLAEGDLGGRAELRGDDELGQVGKAFNKMAEDFSAILSQVQQASSKLADTSSEVSDTADSVAQASISQAEGASVAASSADSLNQSIFELSTRSEQAAASAEETRSLAVNGQEVVNQAAQGIRDIAVTFNESARLVDALGQRSDQIGQIVAVIKDIADQTNLLALNAAIEAARAGEQGRGFAVVADEVRKLAERTTNATSEISNMISTIQSETRNTVSNMDAGNRQVNTGLHLAEQAGESLKKINDSIRQVAEVIRETAATTNQQAATSREISSRVEDIARMARDNSSAVERTTTSTHDLKQLSEELQQLVSRFRFG